jgi:hypothetical protein
MGPSKKEKARINLTGFNTETLSTLPWFLWGMRKILAETYLGLASRDIYLTSYDAWAIH